MTDATARIFKTNENADSYDFNPQYDPAKCGLELVAEIETGGSYEFCTTLLFRDVATGGIYIAQDAGCSCPTPFEDCLSLADMVQPQTEDEVARLLASHHYDSATPTETMAFVRAWKDARTKSADPVEGV